MTPVAAGVWARIGSQWHILTRLEAGATGGLFLWGTVCGSSAPTTGIETTRQRPLLGRCPQCTDHAPTPAPLRVVR